MLFLNIFSNRALSHFIIMKPRQYPKTWLRVLVYKISVFIKISFKENFSHKEQILQRLTFDESSRKGKTFTLYFDGNNKPNTT